MLARKPLCFFDFLYLFARAFRIPFVEQIGKGGKFVAFKTACIHIVHDGDKTHACFGVDDFGVRADLDIVPAETG